MLSKAIKTVFGTRNDRIIKKLKQRVSRINQLEPELQALADAQLAQKTEEFRKRFAAGETLEQLLDEAFAVCREASVRTLGLRHYDVQLIGGMILHNNQITEMRTGEGKTLVATLPAYLNAISGKGVHIVTVNDYLAERDAEWMGQIYNFLGLSVGVVLSTMDYDTKRESYQADITYGTNNQFGFDYMHDNLCFYAIVDEVDSILIDEARTPLIISGQASDSSDLYSRINSIIPQLTRVESEDGPGDYSVDEKSKQAFLTESGHDTAERLMVAAGLLSEGESLYDAANIALVHHLTAGLRAHAIYNRDVDYIVQDGSIVIVAPGDRGQGRRQHPARKSDYRLDYLSELLQALQQARRHDGHRRYRGFRVSADLRPRGRRGADQSTDDSRGYGRPDLPDDTGKVRGNHRRHS
jgi:preprotein translocase subunit SecA